MGRPKKYEDHGGVLTLQQSLYHAINDYPGRLQAVCAVAGWESNGSKSNKFSLTQPQLPNMDEVTMVLEITRDPRILTAICHPVGAVWHWSDDVEADPADLDVLACGASVFERAGAAVNELTTALADGEVDADELARIRQRSFELRQALKKLETTAEGFAK